MFVLVICILTLHGVNSACVLKGICTENKAVQEEIVEQHNEYRREVKPSAADMLKMIYSENLALSAQAWVDHCVLDHGKPSSRMRNGYELGENMFYSSSPISWKKVVTAWHNEVANYNYSEGSINGKAVGHFTQNVWNSSYKVGCGVTLCPHSIYLYACHYFRAGNFRRWPPYKAGQPCALCPDHCDNKLCTNPCQYIDKFLNCPMMKKILTCNDTLVSRRCPASCKCQNKIIPIQ